MNLTDLHVELAEKIHLLEGLAAAEGIEFAVTSGARSFARQALLYTTFRRSQKEAREKYGVVSAPSPMGISRHHPYFDGKAAAVDLAVRKWPKSMSKEGAQRRLGEIAEEVHLVWGGRWAHPDAVHFELLFVNGERIDTSREYIRLGERLDRLAGILEAPNG